MLESFVSSRSFFFVRRAAKTQIGFVLVSSVLLLGACVGCRNAVRFQNFMLVVSSPVQASKLMSYICLKETFLAYFVRRNVLTPYGVRGLARSKTVLGR